MLYGCLCSEYRELPATFYKEQREHPRLDNLSLDMYQAAFSERNSVAEARSGVPTQERRGRKESHFLAHTLHPVPTLVTSPGLSFLVCKMRVTVITSLIRMLTNRCYIQIFVYLFFKWLLVSAKN